jgi:two-component system sensor histidine kinase KdpD
VIRESLPPWRAAVRAVGSAGIWLTAASLVVWFLEETAGVDDASTAYLLAVVAAAVSAGTLAAVLAAAGAFLLYDFLFTRPVHTFFVADPQEWLTLLLLLFVGVVVGRLAARERERALAATRREREALATFRISYTLALAPSTTDALGPIAQLIAAETKFERVWVTLGADDASERVRADTGVGDTPSFMTVLVLKRRPGDEPAEWIRVHAPSRIAGTSRDARQEQVHRVLIGSGATRLGSIWSTRRLASGPPTREEARLVSAAADQVARALERDVLAGESVDAEVARRSDRLKTALLESVSHDLRTPLAAIRAAAGSLVDPEVKWRPGEVRSVAASIDRDAERLSALVANLLDLGRIEGGALRPDRQPFVLADLVGDAVERLRPLLAGRELAVDVPPELPPLLVDSVYVDQALGNILENAVRHTPTTAPISISAREADGTVALVVEDGGPGVSDEVLPRIFERFYRVVAQRETSRRGTGIGLTVVRGLIEASGGTVAARRSGRLGGLAIEVRLPIAPKPVLADPGPPTPAAAASAGPPTAGTAGPPTAGTAGPPTAGTAPPGAPAAPPAEPAAASR